MENLIDIMQLSTEEIDELVKTGCDIMEHPAKYAHKCDGKILATLFFEPSTRTRLSFESAMLSLGGQVLGFSSAASSSASKGESVADTIRVVSAYCDIIAMRHPKEGAPLVATMHSLVPVINAGDGGHLHPTQTLTDLLTLKTELGRLDNLTVGLCGDLKYGRTVHSILKALSCYKNNKFILISTPSLALPQYIKDVLHARGCEFKEAATIYEAIGECDMLYMTRIQQERFASREEYEKQKGVYILTREKMQLAKKNMIVMHPLPRVNEIEVEIDDDPRAAYFRQAKCGMYVRMALILMTLNNTITANPLLTGQVHHECRCTNPRCITQTEHYLPHSFRKYGDIMICEYCDERILLK